MQKKYADFEKFKEAIMIIVGPEATRIPYTLDENSYDDMCFMRWLAMAYLMVRGVG